MDVIAGKTIGTAVLDWAAATATGSIRESAEVAVTTELGATFFIQLGRSSGSAFTAGPTVRIEGSSASSGDDNWFTITSHAMAVGSSVANSTLNGAVSAGATSFVITSATGIAAGDVLFVGDASTANYEVVRVLSVSGTTVNIEDAFVYSHTTGAQVTDQAELIAVGPLCMCTYTRVRVVLDNKTSGQSVFSKVTMNRLAKYVYP